MSHAVQFTPSPATRPRGESDMAQLTPYEAVAICEGFDGQEREASEIIAAWQYLIDMGLVWQLQGWFGRTAHDLINRGICRDV